ncbi:hypothetical protein J2Z69_001718 [Paenibacillus shirakamiensis]|uniref:Uncharacterized protein n=1 Tax=Paenibacillus shirakamiensis TaxID=1265935 RepID=A0ABS4JG61_9BACL|nr:hypothetical protein [Paenibacillus shirakamiensis]MBP2000687.1 hypothetical protein [Paenibacillus shirakamiensis]
MGILYEMVCGKIKGESPEAILDIGRTSPVFGRRKGSYAYRERMLHAQWKSIRIKRWT